MLGYVYFNCDEYYYYHVLCCMKCLFREWPLLQAAAFSGADTPDTGTNELVPTADFSPPPNALRHFIAASRTTSELIRTV